LCTSAFAVCFSAAGHKRRPAPELDSAHDLFTRDKDLIDVRPLHAALHLGGSACLPERLRPLDFNELLVQNPAATFAVRIAGESMTGAGLFPGDIAVVDRSLTPANGCIVLALIDGEFTIKRYQMSGGAVVLRAENPAFEDIAIAEETGLEIWGVLRHSIRML
jgi:phage repressor protein C with HTH and peptisase S24 domain